MTLLQELNLSQNYFTEFPPLPLGIETLIFSHNALARVGQAIHGIALKDLCLSGNPLGHFPEELLSLTGLELLQLNGCGIRSLPTQMTQLTALDTLDLRNNPLTSEECAKVGHVKKLEVTLSKTNTQIKKIL